MPHMLKILDGNLSSLTDGAVVAIVSILLVFFILGIIILITSFAGGIISKMVKKKAAEQQAPAAADDWGGLDMQDEDAVAAVLAASIDYRNEIHGNVRVVKVREIK